VRGREKRRRSEGEERKKREKEKEKQMIGEGRRLERAFDNRMQFSDGGVGGVGREPFPEAQATRRGEAQGEA